MSIFSHRYFTGRSFVCASSLVIRPKRGRFVALITAVVLVMLVYVTQGTDASIQDPTPEPGIAPTATLAALAPPTIEPVPASRLEHHTITAQKRDTLSSILLDHNLSAEEAHIAADQIAQVWNPRRLKVGQTIHLTTLVPLNGPHRLQEMEIIIDPVTVVSAKALPRAQKTEDIPGALEVETRTIELDSHLSIASSTIENSLFADADDIPHAVLVDAVRLFSHVVDFQRDIHPGDQFEVLYQQETYPDGTPARTGAIVYAHLTIGGKPLSIYRMPFADYTDYVDTEGKSVRRMLMRTPIDGARISSRFGMRLHPILGYNKAHRGVDFAAPTGTPIYASGHGTVIWAKTHGAYGKAIVLRHNAETKTRYAHLSKILVRPGQRVTQGDVIGLVGSTGRSTGPHLHYEVLLKDKQVDPMSIDVPAIAPPLSAKQKQLLADLVQSVDQARQLIAAATPGPTVLENPQPSLASVLPAD
ncbi:MAG: peptidoglycan DD-metalloendopeptidase family protein [Pseudomonadota bacterium]